MTKKEMATSFLKMVVDKKVKEAYEKFISPKCIHHNQHFKGDAKSLMIAMEENNKKNPNKSLVIKRVYEDGDTVITLSHVKPSPEDLGVALVHIFRFENDKVVELWDQGQPLIKDSPNENGVF
jgi:predicted SnoaL-like aldol condensation-catalyzing enzyme